MANNENCRKLLESPLSSKLEVRLLSYLQHALIQGTDVDTQSIPMIARLISNREIIINPEIDIISIFENQMIFLATPALLLELLANENVYGYEKSEPVVP